MEWKTVGDILLIYDDSNIPQYILQGPIECQAIEEFGFAQHRFYNGTQIVEYVKGYSDLLNDTKIHAYEESNLYTIKIYENKIEWNSNINISKIQVFTINDQLLQTYNYYYDKNYGGC